MTSPSKEQQRPPRADLQAELAAAQERNLLLTRPGFLIRRLHQIHSWLFAQETAGHDVTPVQYSLLSILAERGEMDQNTLSAAIGLERTSVAEVLRRLQARELIDRRPAPSDKRVRLVRLLEPGQALVHALRPAVERAHARTIEQLDPEHRAMLMLGMIQLVETHNDLGGVPLALD